MEPGDNTFEIMNMMLSKKRAADRKDWLQAKGDLAEI
jgi:topoisomerase-4 subunit B